MPGLFSRYGAMGNPLFDALALTQAGGNVAAGNLAAMKAATQPDLTSMAFANRAYQTGEMVPTLPRQPGLFSNLGVKLGMLSPEVAARPKDVSQMQDVLAGERKEQLDDLKALSGLRTALGPVGFSKLESEPSMRALSMFATGKGAAGIGGTPALDLSALTPKEEQAGALERYRQSEVEIANKRIAIANAELELQRKKEARLESIPKFGTPEYKAYMTDLVSAKTTAGETAKDNLYANSWDYYNRVNKGHLMYYDKNSLQPVDMRKVKSPADAANDPVHYKQVSEKGADILNKIRDEINRSNNIINDVSVIFPDTRNMNRYQKAKEITKWGISNKTFNRYNKDVIDFKQVKADVMQYIRELQQRYPTRIELKEIGDNSFPDMLGDGREDAIRKMNNIVTSLRTAADVATTEENKQVDFNAAKADYNRNTYGYDEPGPAPEAETPLPPIPEGMPPAPTIPSDETPGDVMGGGGGTP